MSRLRYNFITGLCNLTGNTLTLASGISVTVTSGSGDYLPIAINPSPFVAITGSTNTEIVWVTAYTAGSTTATVIRGQEGTSALSTTIWPIGTPYTHGSTTQDFGLLNQLENNDFPNPTASGQILVSLAAGSGILPTWDTLNATISGFYPGLVVSGSQITGPLNSLTVLGNTVLSGTNLNIYSTNVGGIAVASGYVLGYNGSQWVAASGIVGGGGGSSNPPVAIVNLTNQSSAIAPTTLFTASANGLYQINYFSKITTPGATSSTLGPLNITSTDTDGNTSIVYGDTTSNNTVISGFINNSVQVYVASGTNVLYSNGYASTGGISMQYDLHIAAVSYSSLVTSGTILTASTAFAATNLTAQSGAIGTTTLYTVPQTGLYTVNYYGKVTTPASTSSILGNFSLTSTDPDSNTITTQGNYTTENDVVSGFISGSMTVYVGSGTNISYSNGYTSVGATPMQYNLHVSVGGTIASNANIPGVTSFNGRSGAVSPAKTDYSAYYPAISGGTIVSGTFINSTYTNGIFTAPAITSGTLNNITSTSGLFNSGNFVNPVFTSAIENFYSSNTGISGTAIISLASGSVWFYTVPASGNFYLDFITTGGISGTLGVGQAITGTVLTTQGSTAYTVVSGLGTSSPILIDGVTIASGNVYWQGGTAPASGNANGIDVYSVTMFKTAPGTYTVLAARTTF